MGIVRSRFHKRKVSGGKTKLIRKKRKFELARLPGMTRLGARRVAAVRVRGGSYKVRGLRLDTGNFAWPSEAITQRARILDVVYNATSNELVRTKRLVKNCIVSIDAAPYKQWYAKQYGIDFDEAKKKAAAVKSGKKTIKPSKKAKKDVHTKFDVKHASASMRRKWAFRLKTHKVEKGVEDQLKVGRLLARLTSRPGQCGKADGAILEGPELQFYMKKLEKKKKKK